MYRQKISLISFGYFDKGFLKKIAQGINHELVISINILEGHLDLSEYYDPVRRQYNATQLLKDVDSLYAGDSNKTIGIFNVDLYIPILTYIFGQAFLNGNTGIVSLYRFSNERYGMIPDEKMIIERLIKEVMHELGHTFGLIHCHIPTCVMRSSTYIEDIDQKSHNFCVKCRDLIKIS